MPMSASRMAADPSPVAETLDQRRYALDERRYALDQRRLALEESWPRKWGSVLLSAAATVSVAMITAGLTLTQNYAARTQAERAAKDADKQREVENNRTALDMYFRYVADKPEDQPHKADHIQLVESIAANQKMLERLGAQQTRAALETRNQQAPSTAVAGLPDLKSQPVGHSYAPQDFTGYVQYFAGRGGEAERVADVLRNLGMRVPATQAMPAAKSPDRNQIRIYRAAHRSYAERLAGFLKTNTALDFQVALVGGGKLPNGICEIWLGKSA